MKTHDNDCTSLLDLCRHGNSYSIMEEDQACAMDRDPGKLLEQFTDNNYLYNLKLCHSLGRFSRQHIDDLFIIFPENRLGNFMQIASLGFDLSCKLSPETISMKHQSLFAGKILIQEYIFVSFGIIEPILATLKIEYCLSLC